MFQRRVAGIVATAALIFVACETPGSCEDASAYLMTEA